MRKLFSIFILTVFMAGNLNAFTWTRGVEEKEADCVDSARAVAFFLMDYYGLTDEQGAEIVLILIEDCDLGDPIMGN